MGEAKAIEKEESIEKGERIGDAKASRGPEGEI